MSELKMLMIAPAPAVRIDGDIFLDEKFASGMALQASLFPGTFDCLLREVSGNLIFSKRQYTADDGFGLTFHSPDQRVTLEDVSGYDLIFCSADDERNFYIADLAKQAGAKLATTLEYTLDTRLRIEWLSRTSSLPKKLYRTLRTSRVEQKRRAFLSKMDGIQANGFPALMVCRKFDPDTLLFLDNRMTDSLFATSEDMSKRQARILQGGPLNLVFSGRLEPLKGALDLVSVATKLREMSVPFTFDIFGDGSLKAEILDQIEANGLSDNVHLKGAIDFETELVPTLRETADLFVCCHKQGDPSCTYIESNGCGLPIVGYDNAMWSELCKDSGSGWAVPMGRAVEIAAQIRKLHENREELVAHGSRALNYAKEHSFEILSKRRMDHLAHIANA